MAWVNLRWVYVLELERGNYYVGSTYDLEERIQQHFSGNGAQWTKKHKPLKAVLVANKPLTPSTEPAPDRFIGVRSAS